jgi:hypothetical protein
MKSRNGTWGLLLSLLLALAALPAYATFPGKNGRIAFVQGLFRADVPNRTSSIGGRTEPGGASLSPSLLAPPLQVHDHRVPLFCSRPT